MEAYINADLFRAVSLFQSTDEENRPYLCGVFVEPHPIKGLLLTATDGHRLFNVWDESGSMTGYPTIIALPKAILKECKSKNAGRGFRTAIKIDGDVASLHRTAAWNDKIDPRTVAERGDLIASTEESCIVDGTYPDWRRVVPADVDGGAPASFDASQVATFADALKIINAFAGTDHSAVSIVGQDSTSPALVRFPYALCFGVLMPMRVRDAETGTRPAYLDAKPYDRPRVRLTKLDGNRIYFGGNTEPTSWSFDVAVSLSAITGETSRTYTFRTKPEAARAYNRILAGLHARGMCADMEPVYPHYDLKPDAVKAMEDRAERINEAREAFEAAEPIDLGRPWQRNVVVEFQTRVMNRYAFERLPALSEGRALASLYKAAA